MLTLGFALEFRKSRQQQAISAPPTEPKGEASSPSYFPGGPIPPAERLLPGEVATVVRDTVTLTARQRSTIHDAIDCERRRLAQQATSSPWDGTGRHSLSDWCIAEAHGDALLAVDLAVSARESVRRRREREAPSIELKRC